MTAKEYREKKQITEANFWNGDEIDFNMVYEFAEEYSNEQLRLHNVSNRRELLLAYVKYQNSESYIPETGIDDEVDKFLRQ